MKVFLPVLWPFLSFSAMSGSPAAARMVGQPVLVADDLVRDRSGLDLAGKAHHAGHAVGALPARVLLVPERRRAGIGPSVHVRPVVGAVLHERVVGDAELVQEVEHLADALVVVDHHVVVLGLPAAGLAPALRLHMRPAVHVRGVEPHEERLAGVVGGLDELLGGGQELVVARSPSASWSAARCSRSSGRPCRPPSSAERRGARTSS